MREKPKHHGEGDSVPRYITRPSIGYKLVSALVWAVAFFIVSFVAVAVRRIRVEGRKHIRDFRRSGGLIISNHCGYFDPAFIDWILAPGRTYFTTIPRNMDIPVGGTVIKYLGAFSIPRRKGYQRLSRCFGEIAARRGMIHFFPEVFMVPANQKLQRFHRGPFRLAADHNAEILPVVFVWLPGRIIPAWKRIVIVVEAPTKSPGRDDEGQWKESVRNRMQEIIITRRRYAGVEPIDPPFDPRGLLEKTKANHH